MLPVSVGQTHWCSEAAF